MQKQILKKIIRTSVPEEINDQLSLNTTLPNNLNDALKLAEKNNPKLMIAELDYKISERD